MNYKQAMQKVPADAEWSSSFGNPGEGGYVEYYRASDGSRWKMSNGSYLETAPFAWAVEEVK